MKITHFFRTLKIVNPAAPALDAASAKFGQCLTRDGTMRYGQSPLCGPKLRMIPARGDLVRSFRVLSILVLVTGSSAAQQVETNLTIFRRLSFQVGQETADSMAIPAAATVHLAVEPVELAWLVDDGFTQALSAAGLNVSTRDTGSTRLACIVEQTDVIYSNIRRDGLMGPKIVDRSISLAVRIRTFDREQGLLRSTRELQRSARDTIQLDDIERIEQPNLPVLKGRIPPEGFFSSIAEPLIVIGALAVAVFLLFKVRSS